MRKKSIILISLFALLINTLSVSAQTYDSLLNAVEQIGELLTVIFVGLDAALVYQGWLKFFFFLIVYSIIWAGMQQIPFFKEGAGRRAGIIFAFVITLVAAIFVPIDLLRYIFETYSSILIFVFGAAPFVAAVLVGRNVFPDDSWPHRIARSTIYIVFSLGGLAAATKMVELSDGLEFMDNLMTIAAVFAVVGIIAGISTLFGVGAQATKRWKEVQEKGREKKMKDKPSPKPDDAPPNGEVPDSVKASKKYQKVILDVNKLAGAVQNLERSLGALVTLVSRSVNSGTPLHPKEVEKRVKAVEKSLIKIRTIVHDLSNDKYLVYNEEQQKRVAKLMTKIADHYTQFANIMGVAHQIWDRELGGSP